MKLLRTIQLDASDSFVFDEAAEPGEWAVSGVFAFWAANPAALEGKSRAAFRSGFLGVKSLGRSTLAQIVETGDTERAELVATLAAQLMKRFDAPDVTAATAAAEEEVAFTESLCTQPQDTLIAVHRSYEDGAVRERFRTLRPRQGAKPARAFSFFSVEGDDQAAPEHVDLISLAEPERK